MLCSSSWMTKVSSIYLFHRLGGCGAVARASSSNLSIYIYWPQLGWVECPLLPLLFAGRIYLGKQSWYYWDRIPEAGLFGWLTLLFSCVNPGHWSNLSLMMSNTGFIGTDVKSACTSYDVMHSPGLSLIFLTWSNITSATKAITSAYSNLHTYGNTISHIGNNISQKW